MDAEGTHRLHKRTCYLHSKIPQERILLDSIRAGLQILNSNGNTPTAFTACNGTRVCWFSSSRPLSDTRNCTHAQMELMQSSFCTKRTGLDNVPATNTHKTRTCTALQLRSKSWGETGSRHQVFAGSVQKLSGECGFRQKQSLRYWGRHPWPPTLSSINMDMRRFIDRSWWRQPRRRKLAVKYRTSVEPWRLVVKDGMEWFVLPKQLCSLISSLMLPLLHVNFGLVFCFSLCLSHTRTHTHKIKTNLGLSC